MPDILYENRETTVRTIEAIDKDISDTESLIEDLKYKLEDLKELRQRESKALNDIDNKAEKVYGKYGAQVRGFAV